MAQAQETLTKQEQQTYLPNIFIFGFPGSRLQEVGGHLLKLANEAEINPDPYTLIDLTELDDAAPFEERTKKHIERAQTLAGTSIPKIVLAGPEVLIGDNLVPNPALRNAIGTMDERGKRNGASIMLDVDPLICLRTFKAGEEPFIFEIDRGRYARKVVDGAKKLAHEVVTYDLSMSTGEDASHDLRQRVEIVGSMIGQALFDLPADHKIAQRHAVRLHSNGY